MTEWIRTGVPFLALASSVGEDQAKLVILSRFYAGLLVAKITRLVTETEADIFAVDLNAYNAQRRKDWPKANGPYREYDFPEFSYSALDDVIRDKDALPAWLSWGHWKAPSNMWSAPKGSHCYRADWVSGEFATRYYHRVPQSEKDRGDYTDTVAAGVMLRADLIEIIPEMAVSDPAGHQIMPENRGGRPAQRHGDAIAQVTLELSALTPEEFRRHTSASVAEDLLSAYRLIGENPPSRCSAELYAAGILRTVRDRKTQI